MWQDAVGSSSVHEKTPVGNLIQHVDQLPGGDGVEPPRAAQFPDQEQGAWHPLAFAPKQKCLKHSPLPTLACSAWDSV
jgi:hypothetical protein